MCCWRPWESTTLGLPSCVLVVIGSYQALVMGMGRGGDTASCSWNGRRPVGISAAAVCVGVLLLLADAGGLIQLLALISLMRPIRPPPEPTASDRPLATMTNRVTSEPAVDHE